MEIRIGCKNDVKNISEVYVDSWRITYRGLVPDDYLDKLSYIETEKKWMDFLNNEKENFIFVVSNEVGNIIGFASGRSIGEKDFGGELYSLYLLQECREKGLGRLLVKTIAKHFKEKGIDSMMVWVMKNNELGLGFYKNIGGKAYNERTSTFGGAEVKDVAFGWNDISVLCTQ